MTSWKLKSKKVGELHKGRGPSTGTKTGDSFQAPEGKDILKFWLLFGQQLLCQVKIVP